MGEILVVALGLAAGAYALRVAARKDERRLAARRAAAVDCGLSVDDTRAWSDPLSLRTGHFTVRLDSYSGRDDHGMSVEIRSDRNELSSYTVHGLASASFYQKHEQVICGDAHFDSDVIVAGPEEEVRAMLDVETRRVLSAAVLGHGLELAFGVLRARVSLAMRDENHYRATMAEGLRVVLDAAARLARKPPVPGALAENVARDPVPSVRAQSLRSLVRAHPRHETTAWTLRAASRDPSAEVRLCAGIALGPDGDPTLIEVAADDRVDDAWRARAIDALGPRFPYWRAKAILERALPPRATLTGLACVSVLVRDGEADAAETLTRLVRTAHGGVAAAAARGLGVLGAPGAQQAESTLLEALASQNEGLARAAAEALGKIGTVRAVLPLKEAEAAVPNDKAFQRAARHAVAEIQARLTGASAGQLSLASAEGGALSLAEDAEGHLSLGAPDPPGRDRAKPGGTSRQ